ncbi:hypothetical protein HDU99_002165 [Rhizoclosmatium hyalinum]|nr:hypothetical protein HDU99_002165 [Rhizoclosmatium hyalinum]
MPFCPLNRTCTYPNSNVEGHLRKVHKVQDERLLEALSRYGATETHLLDDLNQISDVKTQETSPDEEAKFLNHMIQPNFRKIVLGLAKSYDRPFFTTMKPTVFRAHVRNIMTFGNPKSVQLSALAYKVVWLRIARQIPRPAQVKPDTKQVQSEMKVQTRLYT